MRVAKDPDERRTEIMNAAEELFTSQGYTNTTIQDILKRVGIAKGTFYYYFQSKEELMDAVVMRFIEMGVTAAKAIAADPDLRAPEKMFQIIMAQRPSSQSNSNLKEEMVQQLHEVNNAEMHQKSLVETILQLTPVLTDVVQQGIEEGVFHTPYPRETIEFLLVSSQFLLDEGIFQWEPQELLVKAQALVHIIETTLGAKSGSFAYIFEMYQ